MFGIKTKIKLFVLKRKWKKEHPESLPVNCFNPKNVYMGKWSYGELNVLSFNNHSKLFIGSFVSIAQDVSFLLDVEHSINTVSTYPFYAKVLKNGDEATSKGNIVVDDDVWIGYGATILSGVHIGQGAVIAAGAVVSKDVEPYSIVGGVPAKIIKYRFEKPLIDLLLTFDYRKLDETMIKTHIGDLYCDLVGKTVEEVENIFDWFPKK